MNAEEMAADAERRLRGIRIPGSILSHHAKSGSRIVTESATRRKDGGWTFWVIDSSGRWKLEVWNREEGEVLTRYVLVGSL